MKKVIIPVSPISILGAVGYYSRDPPTKRRRALNKAMKEGYIYKDIMLRLNAVAIRFKNRFPEITKNIRSDMEYMKQKYK